MCPVPAPAWEGLCRCQLATLPCLSSSLSHDPHKPDDDVLWVLIPFGSGTFTATGVLFPGMAVETTKKGLSPSSPRPFCMASGRQDLGVRHSLCLLPASQRPLGQQPKVTGEITFFLREKRENEKKKKRESTKKNQPQNHLCNS